MDGGINMEYDVTKSPGLGAFFSGQRRMEDRSKVFSELANEELTRQGMIQKMMQQEQLFPLELQGKQLSNQSTQANLERTKGLITDEERKRRMEATDKFFEFMQKYDDPQGAVEYSGVPPKFAQQFMQMTPEQRDKVYEQWTNRSLRGEKAKREMETKFKIQETTAAKNLEFTKAEMQERERTKRALEVARINAEARIRAIVERAKQIKNQSYQQYATQLMKQIMEVKRMPEETIEQQQAKIQLLSELAQQLDVVVQQDLQDKAFAAMQRQSGQPNIGALSGGKIPTNPDPQPQLPGQQLIGQPSSPQQYIVGKVYRGKTGSYLYTGKNPDNPKDMANWQKVQ